MLEDFYRANTEFVARRLASPPVDIPPKAKLAIVSCMDNRLAALLPDALGLARGDAYHIANAGNTSTRWDDSILRSVAVAVLAGGVRHVAVIGHTECRMAGDTLPLIDAMRGSVSPAIRHSVCPITATCRTPPARTATATERRMESSQRVLVLPAFAIW